MSNPFEPSSQSGSSGKPVHPLEKQPPTYQQPMPPSSPPPGSGQVRSVAIQQSQPIFTYVFLAINIIVFIADHYFLQYLLTDLGVKSNELILAGQLWRFITPVFLHGSELHLAANSYFLFMVGPQVERGYGPARFVAIYLLSGFAGVIASFALSPAPSLGASGALFGLIGVLVLLFYRNRSILRDTQRQIMSLVQVIVINLLISLAPGIDGWGHVGGLVGGLALGWFATPLYRVIYDLDGSPRVNDGSSGAMVWGSIVVIGIGLVGAAYFVMVVKRLGLIA